MTEIINDPIKVGAIFDNSRIKPKWFIWGTRQINIAEVNYTWQTRTGRDTFYHFAVSDGRNVYELAYNVTKSKWDLIAVEAG